MSKNIAWSIGWIDEKNMISSGNYEEGKSDLKLFALRIFPALFFIKKKRKR